MRHMLNKIQNLEMKSKTSNNFYIKVMLQRPLEVSSDVLLYSYTFKKNGPRKDSSFYQNLISLYETNPDKAKEIISVLPKIGYYKDFMYLLEHSKNNKHFDNYIYDLIISLINKWKEDKHLILAKWLPRENTSFDKKLDFVKILSLKLFPNDRLNLRREKYRKLIQNVMKKLNVLETNLCAKTYDNIQNITENNLKTYEKLFMKNELLQKRLIEILDKKYERYSLVQLLNEYDIKVLHNIRKSLLDKHIEIKRNENLYPEDNIMILDISSEMYNNSLSLLISKVLVYSTNHDEIIVNSKYPLLIKLKKQNLNRDDAKDLVDSHLDINDYLDMKQVSSLVNNKYKNIVILTSKNNVMEDVTIEYINSSFRKTHKDIDILKKILFKETEFFCFWKYIISFIFMFWNIIQKRLFL